MMNLFQNKRILVTGVCGTVGRELVRQLLADYATGELVGLDNNESDLFFLENEYENYDNAHFFLADIRDGEKLARKMRGIDIVFHAAAFKHVLLCERSPFDAVQTNIIGVQNVIQAANAAGVDRVIFTSSDKAVNPTNVMGTSKLMGERLMTAANSNQVEKGTIFASTRFGNVLGSRGSVIPIFREQIKKGGPITLTDPDMTRFIMSIRQAVQLVIDSTRIARGGEVLVTKMPVIRIKDLAEVMRNELASRYGQEPGSIDIKVIGNKPGEKLYEELMNVEETRRALELEKYYSILPAFRGIYAHTEYAYPDVKAKDINTPYNSANEAPLSKAQLKEFMNANALLAE